MKLWMAVLFLALAVPFASAQEEASQEEPLQEDAPADGAAEEAAEVAAPPDMGEVTVDGEEEPGPPEKKEPLVKITVEGEGDGADAAVSVDSAADGVKPRVAKTAVAKPDAKPAAKKPKQVAGKKAAPAAPPAPQKPVLPPEPAAVPTPAVPLTPPTPANP